MPPVAELTFRRATINLNDAARLGEGEDLNDALLDFFVKLGQSLIPKGSDAEAPVAYIGSLFYKQLCSAFSSSGEEGWKHVQNWAKRKAGGLFKPSYAAFSVPINEDLKDDKGNPAGNHWWLALVLNPPGGARTEPTAVMCLDSMQRREKVYEPVLQSVCEGSSKRYSVDVTKVEQAGYLLIVSFDARGDGSMGPLARPERSFLRVDDFECRNPELGLRINMCGGDGYAGRFQGTLTFALDGSIRTSVFAFHYAGEGYSPIKIAFDPFELTKLQKTVTRFLGGYLAKEWEVNGPDKKLMFQKTSARALVADVYQQENLNDCGVFVLENTLRSLSMKAAFLKKMAEATPAALKSFPWPSQSDITARKVKLKAIVARLFEVAAEKGTSDVEKLLAGSDELRSQCARSLTDENASELDKWSGLLQKELAARQVDKDTTEKELREKEAAVQARREEEKRRKEEEEQRRKEEEELAPAKPKNWQGKKKKASASRSLSSSRSRSRQRSRDKKKRKVPSPKSGSSSGGSKQKKGRSGADKRKRSEDAKKKKKAPVKSSKKRGRNPSDSRSEEDGSRDSRSVSRGRNKRRR